MINCTCGHEGMICQLHLASGGVCGKCGKPKLSQSTAIASGMMSEAANYFCSCPTISTITLPASPPPSAPKCECTPGIRWASCPIHGRMAGQPQVAPPSARPAERCNNLFLMAVKECFSIGWHDSMVFGSSAEIVCDEKKLRRLLTAPKSSSLGEEKMTTKAVCKCGEELKPCNERSPTSIRCRGWVHSRSNSHVCLSGSDPIAEPPSASAPDAGQPVITVSHGAAPGVGEPSWASAPASAAREQVADMARKAGFYISESQHIRQDVNVETLAKFGDLYSAEQTHQLREELADYKCALEVLRQADRDAQRGIASLIQRAQAAEAELVLAQHSNWENRKRADKAEAELERLRKEAE